MTYDLNKSLENERRHLDQELRAVVSLHFKYEVEVEGLIDDLREGGFLFDPIDEYVKMASARADAVRAAAESYGEAVACKDPGAMHFPEAWLHQEADRMEGLT